jgi:hypothetical protein
MLRFKSSNVRSWNKPLVELSSEIIPAELAVDGTLGVHRWTRNPQSEISIFIGSSTLLIPVLKEELLKGKAREQSAKAFRRKRDQ